MKNDKIFVSVLVSLTLQWCNAFAPIFIGGFQFPKFPWDNDSDNGNSKDSVSYLEPGDTIAVIGASGNVGKLVSLRLSDTYKVNGIVRSSTPELLQFFEGREDSIKLYEMDLLEELNRDDNNEGENKLIPALKDANAIVICTGTTAFPTEAWSKSGDFSVTNEVLKSLLDNKFSVNDAIRDLDELGLNTPNNVDNRANSLVLDTWASFGRVSKKRVIMLSSIGVQRRTSMPFPILNACGVLTAKAKGEAKLMEAAADGGYSYTIIRPVSVTAYCNRNFT